MGRGLRLQRSFRGGHYQLFTLALLTFAGGKLGNSLGVAELEFFEWLDDDDGGQDLEVLLQAFNSFPGYPTPEEFEILKAKMLELFPVRQSHQVNLPLARKKKKPLMSWNPARVRQVEKQALERGVNPWEIVQIRKKSWQIGLRKLRARQPTPS